MFINSSSRIVIFFFCLLLCSKNVTAQHQATTPTVEELYKKARTTAFDEHNYPLARQYACRALERSPDYHGIRIFVARLYSWEGKYSDARTELQKVLDKDPDNQQAFLALIDIEVASKHLQQALDKAEQALNYYPKDQELMLKKASILSNMEKFGRAKDLYRDILAEYPDSRKARNGLEAAQLKLMKYQVSISYRNEQFQTNFEPWRFLEINVRRETNYGPISGGIQYASRFGIEGTQLNIDAYPTLTKGLYAYVGGGYSQSSIFPKYRLGLSLHKILPAAFEVSGGVRYFDFTTTQKDFYTGALTKYIGSYLLIGQAFLIPSETGNSQNYSLLIRRYFGTSTTYLGVKAGFGSTSTQIQFSQDVEASDSWSIIVDGQYPLSTQFLIGGEVGYDSSTFQSFTRKRFRLEGTISYRF